MTKIVEASAAVIIQSDGRFLLGQRPEGKPYAGYWEFPGGKVEAGESAREALIRELQEELGITADVVYPWINREFIYPHAHVRLHFFRVTHWQGDIQKIQHSAHAWQHCNAVDVEPLLPANLPIIAALALPDFYAITHAHEIGVEAQLQKLEQALHSGLRLLQIREGSLAADQRENFIRATIQLAHQYKARVLVNGENKGEGFSDRLAAQLGADGVHLTSAQLMQCDARPNFPLVGASCHNETELGHANALGLDFAVLSPVCETRSHPEARALGWEKFAALIANSSIPVYALGGMQKTDLNTAWCAGAHGVAAIRAAWASC